MSESFPAAYPSLHTRISKRWLRVLLSPPLVLAIFVVVCRKHIWLYVSRKPGTWPPVTDLLQEPHAPNSPEFLLVEANRLPTSSAVNCVCCGWEFFQCSRLHQVLILVHAAFSKPDNRSSGGFVVPFVACEHNDLSLLGGLTQDVQHALKAFVIGKNYSVIK